MKLETDRLELRLQHPDEVLAWVESLSPEVRVEISPDWLARLRKADGPDPWARSFLIVDTATSAAVGSCAFKGPPDENGVVEIAYGIDEPHQGRGYATESAGALVKFAYEVENINLVCAHTKQEGGASERVLQKAGFKFVGLHEDPNDGTVRRWEFALDD